MDSFAHPRLRVAAEAAASELEEKWFIFVLAPTTAAIGKLGRIHSMKYRSQLNHLPGNRIVTAQKNTHSARPRHKFE